MAVTVEIVTGIQVTFSDSDITAASLRLAAALALSLVKLSLCPLHDRFCAS